MDNFFIFYFLFAPDIRIECVYYNRQIDLENNTKKYIYLYSAFHNILPKLYIYLYSAIHKIYSSKPDLQTILPCNPLMHGVIIFYVCN